MSQKIYDMVTDRIIEILNSGKIPWCKPWNGGVTPMNAVSKKAYRGINHFMLSCLGYSSPYYLTYKQAVALGGYVKKGEKGCPVVFWKFFEDQENDNGEIVNEKRPPMLRYYTVFNVEQTEGIPKNKIPENPKYDTIEFNPITKCERVVDGMQKRPEIRHCENRAYYRPSDDHVNMPPKENFLCCDGYYSTLFHELVHSTGHASRLGRKGVEKVAAFGSADYSREELVAEMGASFLCGWCGIGNTIQNSAAYIQGWLKALRNDKNAVVIAAQQAQKAADYILGPDAQNDENGDE